MSAAPIPALSKLGRAAMRYADQGWRVFPLKPRDKRPLEAGGFHHATDDAAQVRAWWTRWPDANIGLWPGPSGFVVLDLDGPDGEQAAATLGVLDLPTLEVVTGREDGGRHRYYRHPGGHIPNGQLAPKLDVRADAGYVLVPPSIHPTGAVYAWRGKAEDVQPIPAPALERLRALGTAAAATAAQSAQRAGVAAEIPTLAAVPDGARTDTIVRYTGRLLAKGLPVEEVLALVSGLNQRVCTPPLPEAKIASTVVSMAATHARKHGPVAVAVVENPADPTLPSPEALAAEQTDAARALLARDLRLAARWAWTDLDHLVGPMLPGDLTVIGAVQGNGKTTLVRAQCDAWEKARVPVLYLPLEVDPAVCRLQWAAARQGLSLAPAVRQQWHLLPEGSRECLESELEQLEASRYLHFVPDKRVSLHELRRWVEWGIAQAGVRVVVVDHFHRMQFAGSADSYRIAVTETARALKDLAREANVLLVATAQLNRSAEPIDPYVAPVAARIKESAGLAEEADVLLMLSRQLKPDLPDGFEAKLRRGQLTELDLADPNVLRVTCRKHRLDDEARDRFCKLTVRGGRITGYARLG